MLLWVGVDERDGVTEGVEVGESVPEEDADCEGVCVGDSDGETVAEREGVSVPLPVEVLLGD